MNIPLISQLAQLFGGAVTDFMTIRRIKAEGRINLERARQDAELKRVTSMEDYDTLAVQGMLAERGFHRAAKVPDLLIAAVAEMSGYTVLHVDRDFELIAEVTGQPIERLSMPS